MFKKLFIILILVFSAVTWAVAGQSYTLKAGVSMVDKVPKAFYGTWRVTSHLVTTNSHAAFKESSVDLWNLSRAGNVITLDNPFSGAKASIVVDEVTDKVIRFKKIGDYDGKRLTDIVKLQLNGDKFSGENNLILDTVSSVDNSVVKSERATYKLNGEKISGSSIK